MAFSRIPHELFPYGGGCRIELAFSGESRALGRAARLLTTAPEVYR